MSCASVKECRSAKFKERTVHVPHKEVACMYDEGEHDKNNTIKQAVSVATRLSPRTIEAIGLVVNKTYTDIILNSVDWNTHNLKSTDSILSRSDCRIFKRFLSTSTLRRAKMFVNAIKYGYEEAQMNAIWSAKHWCESNYYRTVTFQILNELFVSSKPAL